MHETDYAYAVAYIKTIENKMLTVNEINEMISGESVDNTLRILSEKGYNTGLEVSQMLKLAMTESFKSAYEVCPKEAPIDLILYENDFHNLKTILKAIVANKPWEQLILEPSVVAPELISECVKSGSYEELPDFIRDTAQKGYELLCSTYDGQLLEVTVDRAYYEAIIKGTERAKSEFLKGWAKLACDIANIKIAIRGQISDKSADFMKSALIPYGSFDTDELSTAVAEKRASEVISAYYPELTLDENSSLSELERLCDNTVMEYLKKIKASCFGFEPILAFLIAKRVEIQTVRIIIAGQQNNLKAEIIRERLRDLYV